MSVNRPALIAFRSGGDGYLSGDYATLLGVAPGSALAWIFPAVFAVAAAAGIAWALIMKATRPRAYAAIGSGPGEK